MSGFHPSTISGDSRAAKAREMVNRHVFEPISTFSFWSAIALPALYIPFLASGLDGANDLMVFLGLFALHVISLIGGRRHYDNQE